jgi:hypothetical protein
MDRLLVALVAVFCLEVFSNRSTRAHKHRPRANVLAAGLAKGWRKVIYAAGLVKATVSYRMHDVAALWWQLADGVLASRAWSRLLLTGPCAIAVSMIVIRGGYYGLVVNAGNLLAICSGSAGLVYGGRKVRKITPKPPRQEQGQT